MLAYDINNSATYNITFAAQKDLKKKKIEKEIIETVLPLKQEKQQNTFGNSI